MGLESEYQEKIITLLTVLFPQAKIYLFGSRARNNESKNSDIDIALDEGVPIDFARIGEAKAIMDALYIPYTIDLLDVQKV